MMWHMPARSDAADPQSDIISMPCCQWCRWHLDPAQQHVGPTLQAWQAERQQLGIQQGRSAHVHGGQATGGVVKRQQQQA